MYELIHTSAPRGLFGGSGYTTVAATLGIPEALRKVLESLSGYEQVFDYGAPLFSANPVAFICQPIGQAAGKSWWVLSRVAVADKDYSGRSNYLAHHVALEHHELPQAGPVALARRFQWIDAWTGEPRGLPVRQVPGIPAFPSPSAAPAWTQAGLDAGWAGHLAEVARSRRGVVQLVYPPGVDPLALVADAVALLPPMERWDARFHTHTSRPRPEHAWAWFPADGTGATDLGRRPGVVHLGLKPACPGGGFMVDQARGKTTFQPVPGGAGQEGFHGIGSGRPFLPVATATDGHGGNHPPSGSWNTPPVPAKAPALGTVLHWSAHGLLLATLAVLAVLAVLAWLVLDDAAMVAKLKTQVEEKGKAGDQDKVLLAGKEKELGALREFKDSVVELPKWDAAELAKLNGKKALLGPGLVSELAKRLEAKDEPPVGKEKEIGEKQLLDAGFKLAEARYLVSSGDLARWRGRLVEQAAMEGKKGRFLPVEDVLSGKEDPIGREIAFGVAKDSGEFIALMAASSYGKDKEAMRAFRGLAYGVPTRESFNSDRLYDYVFRKNDFERKLRWIDVLDKAEEYSRWPDTIRKSPVVVLYATAVAYPGFGKDKVAEAPYRALHDQAKAFLDANPKAREFIQRKLMEVARP